MASDHASALGSTCDVYLCAPNELVPNAPLAPRVSYPRGNTALHMCVYHDQTDMYDHLVEYCGASEHVQNNRSQTPLLLAASLGKVEMLQHVYNKRRRVAWAYGPVTSYSLSLREIDTVQVGLLGCGAAA